MKHIGILTFHWANNYGAVLQAYALQTYIKRCFDFDVEIINFSLPEHEARKKIFSVLSGSKNPIIKCCLLISVLKHYKDIRSRQIKFDIFRHKYLNLSEKISSEKKFLISPPYFDVYVSGSDQVFNPKFSKDLVYFLNFEKTHTRKVAYAASFGFSEFPESLTKIICSAICDFDSLSCRESSGADYLSKIIGKKVPTVVDPTFLLSPEEWEPVIEHPHLKQKYIFVYDLNGGVDDIELARKVSGITGYEVICATNNMRSLRYTGCKVLYNVGPCDFLGYIQNAEYVVTDSFHGTALSLIFRRKVLVYIANKKVSGRITSLMEKLHLTDQIVWNVDNFCFENIIFKEFDSSLSDMLSESKKYLQDALT